MRFSIISAGVVAGMLAATGAQARDQISIVGSSTVYPFATIVAEKFGQSSGFKTPVIESTGTGGGMKLFCKGIGVEHPYHKRITSNEKLRSKTMPRCGR